jgi:hypothetical protein
MTFLGAIGFALIFLQSSLNAQEYPQMHWIYCYGLGYANASSDYAKYYSWPFFFTLPPSSTADDLNPYFLFEL